MDELELREIITSEETYKAYLEKRVNYLIRQSGLNPEEIAAVTNRKKGCRLTFWSRPTPYRGNRNVPSEEAILIKGRIDIDPTDVLYEELAKAYVLIADKERNLGYSYPRDSPQEFSLGVSAMKNDERAWWLRIITERRKRLRGGGQNSTLPK